MAPGASRRRVAPVTADGDGGQGPRETGGALALRSDDPDALYRPGNVHYGQGRLSPALACFGRAPALQPDHVEALCNRGNTLQQLEKSRNYVAVSTG